MNGKGAIDLNLVSTGFAMALATDFNQGTGVKANNVAQDGNPSATQGGNSGELAVAAIEFATQQAGKYGDLAIIGSQANARAAAAAAPGTMAGSQHTLAGVRVAA